MQTQVPPESPTWSVIELHGDVDLASAPRLRQQMGDATADAPAFVVLDLSDLDFIDSTGLGVLVGTLRRVRAGGGDVRLAAARGGIERVLKVTGLDRVFKLFAGVAEACA